jgi:hypothetical protein
MAWQSMRCGWAGAPIELALAAAITPLGSTIHNDVLGFFTPKDVEQGVHLLGVYP